MDTTKKHYCAYHKKDEPLKSFRLTPYGKPNAWCIAAHNEYDREYSKVKYAPIKAEVAKKRVEEAKKPIPSCTQCDKPRKPRHDRPGKFFTLCEDHCAEYQRQKNKESYDRHKDKHVQKAHKRYWEDPEKARAIVRRSIAKPEVHARKMAYMVTYNSPHRAFVKDVCERCGYQTKDPKFKKDLDVHHKDNNHSNNDPK